MKILSLFALFLVSQTILAVELVNSELGVLQQDAAVGYVFDVTVRTEQELDVILERAEQLQKLFDPQQHGRIAIVLHGEELELFQKNGQFYNSAIVDKARLLDSKMVIDIKACQTRMRSLDIGEDELPDFIEQVPLAPVEIRRLVEQQDFTQL